MDVPQRQIVKAAGGDLLPAKGIVPSLHRADLPVKQANMNPTILRSGKSRQQTLRLLRTGKSRAVDCQIPLRQIHCRQRPLPEYMHILRPIHCQPRAAGSHPIMVARSNEYLCLHLAQSLCQLFPSLPESAAAVKQISRQQHQTDLMLIDII